ncbi:unnamed protein product, partial [Rotaria magnacalcarata]
MILPRMFHSATLLSSGQVLVVGGNYPNSSACEKYDPVSNIWTSIASMSTGRFLHTTTLLSDGKLFIVGGFDG